MSLRTLREHFAHHRLHAAACALAVVFVVAAAAFGVPLVAALGALLCGGMMAAMVWMMVRHGGSH